VKSPNPEFLRAFDSALGGRKSLAFSEFLQLALYHPDLGYYATASRDVGRSGDFYTNVSIGPVLAEILLEQVMEMWTALGEPTPFYLIEQGAHFGQFAADFLQAAADKPAFTTALRYAIIEPQSALQQRQQTSLTAWKDQVEWHAEFATLRGVTGVHWSNELIDALPFETLEWNGQTWLERRVARADDCLIFQSTEIPPGELRDAVAELPSPPAPGYQTEIRLSHRPWLRELSQSLERGFVLLCDYGYPRQEYYSPERREGTLMGYQRHQRSDDPFEAPGERDLSAHVDFTSLVRDAESSGFRLTGFTDQHHFLVGAAENLMRQREGQADSRWLRSLRTLLHPELMGTRFQFLALAKLPGEVSPLSGFRFQSAPRERLGLMDPL